MKKEKLEEILRVGNSKLVKIGYLVGVGLLGKGIITYMLHRESYSNYTIFCSSVIFGVTFIHQYRTGKFKLEDKEN